MGQGHGQTMMGPCLIVLLGRLVARNNTFVGGQCGIAVDPLSYSKATTVHLEGNTFSDVRYEWGW